MEPPAPAPSTVGPARWGSRGRQCPSSSTTTTRATCLRRRGRASPPRRQSLGTAAAQPGRESASDSAPTLIGAGDRATASSLFAGGLLRGAVERATRDGYVVVVFDSQDHPEREQAAADELANRQVDGLIYATMGLREPDTVPRTSLPLVLTNCQQAGDPYPSVVPDDYRGAGTPRATCSGFGHAASRCSAAWASTRGSRTILATSPAPCAPRVFALRSARTSLRRTHPSSPWDGTSTRVTTVPSASSPAQQVAGSGRGPAHRDLRRERPGGDRRAAGGRPARPRRAGRPLRRGVRRPGGCRRQRGPRPDDPGPSPHTAMGERAVELLLETVTGRLVPDALAARAPPLPSRRPGVGGTTALTRSDPPSGTSRPQGGPDSRKVCGAAPSPGYTSTTSASTQTAVPGTSRRDWDPDAPRRIHPFPSPGADVTVSRAAPGSPCTPATQRVPWSFPPVPPGELSASESLSCATSSATAGSGRTSSRPSRTARRRGRVRHPAVCGPSPSPEVSSGSCRAQPNISGEEPSCTSCGA